MEIVNINVNEIYPHPDNPRKNLGDITELTDSIKKNGIMQNLTVVPGHWMTKEEFKNLHAAEGGKKSDAEFACNKDSSWTAVGYTAIIGHRRLAASKAAGLKEVPCQVSSMDYKEQLCRMMEENMQRQDLTVIEQACGFQLMLDLGEDVKSIAKRTGFGETTIRHRLEIAKLDRKTLQENLEGGGGGYQLGINDLIELEKIKDIERRNEIISEAYSQADLRSKIEREKNRETMQEALKALKPVLEQSGIKEAPKNMHEWQPGVSRVQAIDMKKKLPEAVELDKKDGAQYYWKLGYLSVDILEKLPKQDKEETEEDRRKAELEERRSKLCELEKELYQLINIQFELVDETKVNLEEGITETEAVAKIWEVLIRNTNTVNFYDLIASRCGKPAYQIERQEKEECLNGLLMRKQSVQMALVLKETMKYGTHLHTYRGEYKAEAAEKVRRVAELQEALYGFRRLSDSLQRLLDGTHELYTREEA